MRYCLLALMLVVLAGCGMGPPPADQARKRAAAAEAKRLAAARKVYDKFLDEADKALQLLEKHPSRDALQEQSTRLHDALTVADDTAPGNEKMGDLVDEGRGVIRYFDACLKVARFQAKNKNVSPEKAQSFVDKTCDANAGPIRELIPRLREKNKPPTASPGTTSATGPASGG